MSSNDAPHIGRRRNRESQRHPLQIDVPHRSALTNNNMDLKRAQIAALWSDAELIAFQPTPDDQLMRDLLHEAGLTSDAVSRYISGLVGHHISSLEVLVRVAKYDKKEEVEARIRRTHQELTSYEATAGLAQQQSFRAASVASSATAANSALSESTLVPEDGNCTIRPNESVSVLHSEAVVQHGHQIPMEATPAGDHDTRVMATRDLVREAAEIYQPLYIRNLAPVSANVLAAMPAVDDMVTFPKKFLTRAFGDHSTEFGDGVWWVSNKVFSILPGRLFYIVDTAHEPFLPKNPGEHGTKITAFFNPGHGGDGPTEQSYQDAPLFVSALVRTLDGTIATEYAYFGQYSQTRFSDRLDYDRMQEVIPEHVKERWATTLSALDRPPWVTEVLLDHFCPKEKYKGPLPSINANLEGQSVPALTPEIKESLQKYLQNFAEWDEEDRRLIGSLTKEDILKAFERADTAQPTGLRLCYEYLECVNYDAGFYAMMVNKKHAFDREQKVIKDNLTRASKPATRGVAGSRWAHETRTTGVGEPPNGEHTRTDANEIDPSTLGQTARLLHSAGFALPHDGKGKGSSGRLTTTPVKTSPELTSARAIAGPSTPTGQPATPSPDSRAPHLRPRATASSTASTPSQVPLGMNMDGARSSASVYSIPSDASDTASDTAATNAVADQLHHILFNPDAAFTMQTQAQSSEARSERYNRRPGQYLSRQREPTLSAGAVEAFRAVGIYAGDEGEDQDHEEGVGRGRRRGRGRAQRFSDRGTEKRAESSE